MYEDLQNISFTGIAALFKNSELLTSYPTNDLCVLLPSIKLQQQPTIKIQKLTKWIRIHQSQYLNATF